MPIDVTCPHCGTHTTADEKYAGTSGPCRSCGKPLTIPGYAYAEDATASSTPPPSKSGSSGMLPILVIVGGIGIVALFVIGILVALLLPAVNAARSAARRAQCVNNLRQIQLAVLNYESANGHFPPAYTVDEDGKPMHSWRVLILPYLDSGTDLYDRYDFSEPWDSAENRALTQSYCPPVYQCPHNAPGMSTNTDYLAVEGPEMLFNGSKPRKMSEIRQGTSNTLSVVEVMNSDVHWAEPRDFDAANSAFGVSAAPNGIGSNHPGGANVAYADGSCRFIANATDPGMLEDQATVEPGPRMGAVDAEADAFKEDL